MNFNLAVVAGDGIGPEVMEQNINVLNAIGEKFGHTFNYEYVLGGGTIMMFGTILTSGIEMISKAGFN